MLHSNAFGLTRTTHSSSLGDCPSLLLKARRCRNASLQLFADNLPLRLKSNLMAEAREDLTNSLHFLRGLLRWAAVLYTEFNSTEFDARGQDASCSLCDDLLAVDRRGPIECGARIIIEGRLFVSPSRTLTAFTVVRIPVCWSLQLRTRCCQKMSFAMMTLHGPTSVS